MRCRSCERSPPERIARQVALRPRYSRRAACHTPAQELARGLTAPRTTAVRRRQPPLADRVRVAGRNAHRDRSVTQDAPTHAGGVASIRDNIAVDDLHAVAIFRAAVPGSRMNDHAPTPVERIGSGRRSFGWSRSNSCGRGRPRADRRAWHHGRNWHDRCQRSEIALPDGPAIELDRHTVDGINRAFVPRVDPDVTGSIDPRSRRHACFINKAEVPAALRDECGLIDQSLDASLDTSIWAGEFSTCAEVSVDAIASNAAAAKNPILIATSRGSLLQIRRYIHI